jgi:hypothetical protein
MKVPFGQFAFMINRTNYGLNARFIYLCYSHFNVLPVVVRLELWLSFKNNYRLALFIPFNDCWCFFPSFQQVKTTTACDSFCAECIDSSGMFPRVLWSPSPFLLSWGIFDGNVAVRRSGRWTYPLALKFYHIVRVNNPTKAFTPTSMPHPPLYYSYLWLLQVDPIRHLSQSS